MTRDFRVLAVNPAHVPYSRERIHEQAGGGGKTQSIRNADFITANKLQPLSDHRPEFPVVTTGLPLARSLEFAEIGPSKPFLEDGINKNYVLVLGVYNLFAFKTILNPGNIAG